jgi:hypothetical protein
MTGVVRRTLQVALLLAVFQAPASAQERLTLTELESLYLSARDELSAAVQSWEVLISRWKRASEEFDQAPAGSRERRSAFAQTQVLADEIRSQERRVNELDRLLREARGRYIDGLELRLDSLLSERNRARSPQDSVSLGSLITDANNRYQNAVAEDRDPSVSIERATTLVRDPRDGPEDLRRKAAQEEYRAEQYLSLIQEIDARLTELRDAQRRDRTARDFLTGLDRFGDTRPPVVSAGGRAGPGRDPGQVPPGVDSVGSGGRPLTLDDRIRNLELQRGLAAELEQRTRTNAQQFRRWAGGGGPWLC